MNFPRPVSTAFAVALAVTAGGDARAEEPPPIERSSDRTELDKAQAATLLNNGNALFEKGDYPAALAKYEKAYATYASPKILFNLGEALSKLGRPLEAAEAYERFVREAKVGPATAVGKKVKERLDALAPLLAHLELGGGPEGAAVTVDGKEVGTLPLPGPVRVAAGSHTVGASKPGFEASAVSVAVAGGATQAVTVRLALPKAVATEETPPIGPSVSEAEVAVAAPSEGTPLTSRWWFWGALGVAAVAAGAGIAVAASAGGGTFVPTGELGASSTATWTHF